MANVFIGMPLYKRYADVAAMIRAFVTPSAKHRFQAKPMGMSLIPANCNMLWCDALNLRGEGFTWYAQLHADVEPPINWVDMLIDEAERCRADFISVAIPQQQREGPEAGCTSMAISMPGNPLAVFTRLTQSQVQHPTFPDTFDIHAAANALEALPDNLRVTGVPREYLLANTGCMVCRIDQPWAERVWFDNPNRIGKVNGKMQAIGRPEDWYFTQRIQEEGGKVMVTKLVHVKHWGLFDYDSREVWGRARDG